MEKNWITTKINITLLNSLLSNQNRSHLVWRQCNCVSTSEIATINTHSLNICKWRANARIQCIVHIVRISMNWFTLNVWVDVHKLFSQSLWLTNKICERVVFDTSVKRSIFKPTTRIFGENCLQCFHLIAFILFFHFCLFLELGFWLVSNALELLHISLIDKRNFVHVDFCIEFISKEYFYCAYLRMA